MHSCPVWPFSALSAVQLGDGGVIMLSESSKPPMSKDFAPTLAHDHETTGNLDTAKSWHVFSNVVPWPGFWNHASIPFQLVLYSSCVSFRDELRGTSLVGYFLEQVMTTPQASQTACTEMLFLRPQTKRLQGAMPFLSSRPPRQQRCLILLPIPPGLRE